MVGLLLTRTRREIEHPVIVTEELPLVSTGDLSLLVADDDGIRKRAVEPMQEATSPMGTVSSWRRWLVRDLEDGVYVADSIGTGTLPTSTYFAVAGGEVRHIFGSDRGRAERELRRFGLRRASGSDR